jgi:hypothetical protein
MSFEQTYKRGRPSGFNPRGSIVMPARPVDIGNGTTATGRNPGVVVYTKAGSGRLMRKFERFCLANGIDARPVQQLAEDGRPDAWECVGTLESLEALTEHEAVADWHLIVSVRVPLGAAGSGEHKPRPSSGTAFGRPETISATADQLRKDHANRVRAEMTAGNL